MAVQDYGIRGTSARRIAESIEAAIREGRVAPGATLPPVRALAAELAVSPGTVSSAYGRLKARGLVAGEGRRGTRVTPRPPIPTRAGAPVPAGVRDLASGNPALGLLPRLEAALARARPEQALYGEPANLPELIELAGRRFAREGIPADALAVVGGAMDGIERVLQAHLLPGDRVVVEDPGYPPVVDLLRALGLHPEPVPVDDFGPRPDDFRRALEGGAVACIVTTRAQNPTGAALDERRAGELSLILDAHPEALVIEDDHAGGVAGVPAASTAHPERRRWALIRSVSKSLGPDLRLAVMAGDLATMARVQGRQHLGTGWVSKVLQRLVVTLWRDAETEALLRTAAETYWSRRQALIEALARRGVEAHGRSGMNVWIPVPEEQEAVRGLLDAGWAVTAGERYRIHTPSAIRVTISTLRPDEADRFAADLARILRPTGVTRSA
ncbi:MAG: aminotransferase class I/II-fold pyridoxal phosphate-dependent enzyme [Actinobacteria bacterium]|nr:aminotransferase class I/II-fold pyridoxal phosphate-dependent enzyme [Actinomycetota bacterium]